MLHCNLQLTCGRAASLSRLIMLCSKDFASVIPNLLSFSAATFHFEVFFIKTTSQMSVDGFEVSIDHLREVSVLSGVYNVVTVK